MTRLLRIFEMKTALVEITLYATSWLYLTFSPYDFAEKLLFGLVSGIGIAAGKWVVEIVKKRLRRKI